ncbi:MAG TPA: SRPBCC domain-containing protein [Caulobacteraceae bacterium]|jgi:uncharacterized protein YndB with AHSA1/START domain|nr:SRPBCC domain-containing protein [Caulobacteraceae bacterium]
MTEAADTETRSLVVERIMPHPPEKIWRALTERPLIEDWLMKTDFKPVVGHGFTLRSEPMPLWNGVIDCEVLAVEAQGQLTYSWSALGLESVVTWTLTPVNVGTHVRMEQSGFKPHQDANYQGAAHGWRRFVDGLERVVGALD